MDLEPAARLALDLALALAGGGGGGFREARFLLFAILATSSGVLIVSAYSRLRVQHLVQLLPARRLLRTLGRFSRTPRPHREHRALELSHVRQRCARLRRSNEDKRRAVQKLLDDAEWVSWSNREIARRCAVDETLVRKMKPEPDTAV